MWESDNELVPREKLEYEMKNADALFCLLTDVIDKDLINKSKRLKIISNMATGYNNIDIESATENGIIVTNTPNVTETTADLTFALLMATARRLVEASDYLREGRWQSWSPMLLTGQDIHGATLGIIGLGKIGKALVKRAAGFEMNIIYFNRNRKLSEEKELGISYAELHTLLKTSDIVCVLTPLTSETKNLIGKEELSIMKPSSILINTSRGGIVNEIALYKALKRKTIWAAGLDVFEEEPVPHDHPLLTLPNVVTLPHIGSASVRTRTNMAQIAATNILECLSGTIPHNIVNHDVIKKSYYN
jgi:glyoxylate reductase